MLRRCRVHLRTQATVAGPGRRAGELAPLRLQEIRNQSRLVRPNRETRLRKGSVLQRKLTAEFLGTLWLVLGGCGSAVLAAAFPGVGIGMLGVSFAFGLTVLTMAYTIGHVSGCHLN